MHVFFKCKILCCGKRHLRCCDTLYSRVICQVDEQNGSVDGTCLLKALNKEVGLLKGNTKSGKYNGEVLTGTANLSLSCDLSGQLRMRKT